MNRLNTIIIEGSLWRDSTIIRQDYARHHRDITNSLQLRSTLRAGEYAWPGGYQLAFITSDGALLCFDCVRKELRNVLDSIRTECDDGWRVVACDIRYDGELECGDYCDHCSKQLAEPMEVQS